MSIYHVDIEFEIGTEQPIHIQKKINAPLYSRIEWYILDLDNNKTRSLFQRSVLKFQIYFQDKSPFEWRDRSANWGYDAPIYSYSTSYIGNQLVPTLNIIKERRLLVSDTAQKRGEFKYGVKVIDVEKEATVYEEDPFLIIY